MKPPNDKKALIIAAYNTPNKFIDLMTAGSTMTDAMKIEAELRLKNFNTIRLVEKRSSYEMINDKILSEFIDIIKNIATEDNSYEDFLELVASSIKQISLLFTTGYEVVYAIDEFDWSNAFINLINGKGFTAYHLQIFTKTNIIQNIPSKTVIVYMGEGNSTHWLVPNETAIQLSQLPFTPSFYYIHYTKGYDSYTNLLDKGALSIIASTGNVYLTQSSYVSTKIFNNFNGPIGSALKDAKNDILEFYKAIENITFPSNPKPYKKEYYTRNLIGESSNIYDPYLELKQSPEIQIKNNNLILKFEIKPEYSIISNNDKNSLYFDSDSFIFVDNKPIIPIYKESILLPEDSEIKSVSIDTITKQYENLTIPISYPDTNYFNTTENFTGQFPQNFYWNGAFSLLDNRKIYDFIFSPVIYYSNNSALVYENINVELFYSSPLEITKIYANDTTKNQPTTIAFSVYNNLQTSTDATFFLLIETNKQTYNLEKKTSH